MRLDAIDVEERILRDCKQYCPFANHIGFSTYNGMYAGQRCYIIGRGPTQFNYGDLSQVKDPVFFINDAVALERHVQGESFFFAHDSSMQVWLDGTTRSTAVLPVGGKVFQNSPTTGLAHKSKIVPYVWREIDADQVLKMSREELAIRQELYTNSGTIHSLLHFVWYCGFKSVVFIGCDGINNKYLIMMKCPGSIGYDMRLANNSHTAPWWDYTKIRRVQDQLCLHFQFEVSCQGTPFQKR